MLKIFQLFQQPLLSSSLSRKELGSDAKLFAATLLKPAKQSLLYKTIVGILAPSASGERSRTRADSENTEQAFDFDASKFKVFMAEDNLVNRKLSFKIFEKLGIELTMTNDGKELLDVLEIRSDLEIDGKTARDIVAKTAGSVIFMDCQMPEMDGYEATGMIRKWEKRVNAAAESAGETKKLHIHIVALTANALQGDRERCIEAGMDDYVTKPLKIDDIKTALANFAKTL